MDIKERVAREIKTWCDADFRYQGYNVGIAKPIEPLADQIIPIVRADCQREIGEIFYRRCLKDGTYFKLYLDHDDFMALKSGTFKEGE